MKIRALIFLPLLTLTLAGCASPTGLFVRGAVVDRAAGAYDESLSNAQMWMCRGASIGSIVRAYGISPERWRAWLLMCGYVTQSELTRPEPDRAGSKIPL